MNLIRKDTNPHRSGAYIGYEALAIMLKILRDGDHTPQSLAAVTGVCNVRLRNILKQMLAMGLLDRVRWEYPKHGFAAPAYRLGTGQAVEAPRTPDGRIQPHADFVPKLRPRIVAFGSIVQCLRMGPTSVMELERNTLVADSRLRDLLVSMHAMKLVHIAAWAKDRPDTPIYRLWQWGEANDAKRPKPRGRKVRLRTEQFAGRTAWASAVMQMKRQAGFQRGICKEQRVVEEVAP